MLPSQFPEFKAYPAVHSFVTYHLAVQFDDVRGMMKLPLPEVGIRAGCNFSGSCNIVQHDKRDFKGSIHAKRPEKPQWEEVQGVAGRVLSLGIRGEQGSQGQGHLRSCSESIGPFSRSFEEEFLTDIYR